MSVSYIPETVKIRLWGKAAGRCEFLGCNKPLWIDALTQSEFNTAYIAHIIADRDTGPRGDKILSAKLKMDISNLMLMCDVHHRAIDKDNGIHFSVETLQKMKKDHENRMELITSINKDRQSQVLLYGANINQQNSKVSWNQAAQAMLPKCYPTKNTAIELSLENSNFKDHEKDYWKFERANLQRNFKDKVIVSGQINHFSVFALAPQPLLIELGRLLSDINAVDVYQLHREPQDWKWQDEPINFEYILKEPTIIKNTAVLNLSLSANIDNSRITKVLGDDISIWTITILAPNNDFMKSEQQLNQFRHILRSTFDKIKLKHGQDNKIHLFPTVPVSAAVEIGRVWMPKADLPISIYDQNFKNGGFTYVFDILYN